MTPENRNTIDDATHDEWLATSRNMKMEISKEWAEKSAKIEGDAAVGAGLPSALGLPKLAAPVSAFPLATGSLSVPAGELEDLYDHCIREMHEHEQIAAACTRDHQKLERFKRTGKAAAWYDASVRVRLLLDRAKERQPTENVAGQARAGEATST